MISGDAFYLNAPATDQEIKEALRFVVRSWTENQIDDCRNPTFAQFIDKYPEWDVKELHEEIGVEMHRVKHGQ